MPKTLVIAYRDLQGFFSRWMGYLIGAMTLLIMGLLFNSFAFRIGAKSAQILSDYFYFSSGVAIVVAILLGMRALAEEKQSGSLVSLYSSPLTERQIVYGKFLSALCFFLFLFALSVHMPGTVYILGKVSLSHIGTGYIGLSLIGASTLAITIFCSALSPNQLVAAIAAAVIVVGMIVLWMLADVIGPPAKAILAYAAFHNLHFIPFAKGLLHLQHVVYYLAITFFFLECSVRAVESRRWQG